LCRYITRPAIAEKRLSLTKQGMVRYELKTPYRDGTTHVIFEPVDYIAKVAADQQSDLESCNTLTEEAVVRVKHIVSLDYVGDIQPVQTANSGHRKFGIAGIIGVHDRVYR